MNGFFDATKDFAETLAILVGGGWAFWKFCLRREGKPALEIDLIFNVIPEQVGSFLAVFDVTLTNKSGRQVLARRRKPGTPAFSDRSEDLQHSCSLLIRRVVAGAPVNTQVRWFADGDAKSPFPTDIVANLLDGYEYENEGMDDFWIEPSESSRLCVGAILEPGVYLAMVTFVGEGGDAEFWRRLFIVQIPEQNAMQSERPRATSRRSKSDSKK
ncbi:MAG TPA: hypothetical protein VGM54_06555 [Chthoniobacter sp.]|jgi:hypothetical protein